MCDLFAAILLFSLTLSQALGCTNLEQYNPNGVSASPVLLRAYTANGELAAEWIASPLGFSHWTVSPELLVFTSADPRGALLAGDPKTGHAHLISRLFGESVRFSDGPWAVVASNGKVQRRIPLPAPLQLVMGDSDPTHVGQFRVDNGELWYAERLLLPNRGMTTSLHASPTGRWVLVRQSQPAHTYVVFSVSTDGSDQVEPLRSLSFDQLPLSRPQPVAESPDGEWSVRYGHWVERFPINGIGVFHQSGRRSVWGAAPIEGPWWSPDSDRFVYIEGDYLVVADLEGNTRQLLHGAFAFLGWNDDRVMWLARGPTDH